MRALKAVIFGVVLAVALTPVAAVSGPFEDGLDAYESGDYATALRLWRPPAEQGETNAQYNLGVMYERGLGVPQDYVEAVKWWRLAAEQGYARAQFNLGIMHRDGHGVPQDYVQAHVWLNLAASRLGPGLTRDQAAAGQDEVAKRMTPTQITEAQKLARQWKPVGERAE